MNLEQFFKKDQVVKLKSREKQHVIRELVEKLQELKLIENKERYYAQIIHRESLENTGIGYGFAIPHARTDSVLEFASILGIQKEGIDYQSFDNKPVKFVLLSIFPTDMSTKYLYLIGMMARIFSSAEKRKSLEENMTPAKTYTFLHREANSYFDSISKKEDFSPDKEGSLSGVPSSNLDLIIRLDRLYQIFDEGNKAESIQKKIDDLRKLIDNRSLTYYERMRKKSDTPFAIIEKNSCSGCHMEIPPIYIREVREGKGISLCTHCGRFLISL